MVKNHFHIAGFLILLISMSLSFSTIHNHEVLNYNAGDQQQSVEHTISQDSTLCPICGYLFHADFSSERSYGVVVQVQAVLHFLADRNIDNSPFGRNRKRGPPLYA